MNITHKTESNDYTCDICCDRIIVSQNAVYAISTTISTAHASSRLCRYCVRRLFTTAIASEADFPPKWNGYVLETDDFFHAIDPGTGLDTLFKQKKKEFNCPLKKRVYCRHVDLVRASGDCNNFVGEQTDVLRCQRCSKCHSYTCLRCRECVGIAGSASEEIEEKEKMEIEHNCVPEDGAQTGLELEKQCQAFEGLIRGKHYQDCPNVACGRRVQLKEGCNAMVCPSCRTGFCYICGERAKESGRHWDRGKSCPRYNQPMSSNAAPALPAGLFGDPVLQRLHEEFLERHRQQHEHPLRAGWWDERRFAEFGDQLFAFFRRNAPAADRRDQEVRDERRAGLRAHHYEARDRREEQDRRDWHVNHDRNRAERDREREQREVEARSRGRQYFTALTMGETWLQLLGNDQDWQEEFNRGSAIEGAHEQLPPGAEVDRDVIEESGDPEPEPRLPGMNDGVARLEKDQDPSLARSMPGSWPASVLSASRSERSVESSPTRYEAARNRVSEQWLGPAPRVHSIEEELRRMEDRDRDLGMRIPQNPPSSSRNGDPNQHHVQGSRDLATAAVQKRDEGANVDHQSSEVRNDRSLDKGDPGPSRSRL